MKCESKIKHKANSRYTAILLFGHNSINVRKVDCLSHRRNQHYRKERWPEGISPKTRSLIPRPWKYKLANSFDYSYHRQPSIMQRSFSFTF